MRDFWEIPQAASMSRLAARHEGTSMKNTAMLKLTVLAALLGAFAIGFSYSASAQNALGGAAKTKQNTVGGMAKPAPVLGGATTPGPVTGAIKPNTVGGVTKQTSVGGTPTPGSTGSATPSSTVSAAKQNPPVPPPNKGGTVVTSSNLKCAAGACVAKGKKP
jgi:hypothetical protein